MLRAEIKMTSALPLEEFKQRYGGSFIPLKELNNPGWKPQYSWQITGSGALAFLKEVRPFLRVKREEADVAIHFQETRNQPNHLERGLKYKTKLQELKKAA